MRPGSLQRVVIKIGSSVLTDARGRLAPRRLERLVEDVVAWKRLARATRQPILVTSGAIACGMGLLGLRARPAALAQLQACAAVGQGELMHRYTLALRRHRAVGAQLLLTREDLADRRRLRNAKQTLLTLLHRRAVPIVNENDTVAVEEITFGDNDRLAALLACAVDAHALIILTDVDGLLDAGRVVKHVRSLANAQRLVAPGATRQTTKGGMASKLEAARIVGQGGIPMIIANGLTPGALAVALSGRRVGTLFVPRKSRRGARPW